MHHLDALQRVRPLKLYYLTPEEVQKPMKKPIIVIKTDYPEISSNIGYLPLVPKVKSQRVVTKKKPLNRRNKRRNLVRNRILYDEGCPTCGKMHVALKYFGHRHICDKCKDFIRTNDNKSVKFSLDKDKNIVAYTVENNLVKEVDYENLMIFEYKCYASFAGEDEFSCFLY